MRHKAMYCPHCGAEYLIESGKNRELWGCAECRTKLLPLKLPSVVTRRRRAKEKAARNCSCDTAQG